MGICDMCGEVCQTVRHHLLFGNQRQLADEDDLVINICIDCHTLGYEKIDHIHENPAAERLSKMLGQMKYERDQAIKALSDCTGNSEEYHKDKVRAQFMKRYGRNYL